MNKFCKNCGCLLEEQTKFCSQCGKNVNSTNSCDRKLIFTYKNKGVDLKELIREYNNENENVMISNASKKLSSLFSIPKGLSKQIIRDAYYTGRVFRIDHKMVNTYIIKRIVILGVSLIFIFGVIPSVVKIDRNDTSSSNEETQSVSSQNTSEKKSESKPENIEDVECKDFYNNYSNDKKGKWIRISGKVNYINKDKTRIKIKDGLSGFDDITIQLKEKREDISDGDYITAVGQVGSKILASIYIEESYIESLGDEAKLNANDYMEVDYKKLHKDYEDNAIAADEKYKDKVIQITGKVDDIFREAMGHPYVTFKVDDYFAHVQATFSKDEESNIAKLKKGQTITVRGRCKGKICGVHLNDCMIINK